MYRRRYSNNILPKLSGWTPYFPLLGGVVTEIGGFLSHGAVVAREFGLPAVVGVQGVTQLVSQGDIIRIDGALGTITIIQKTSAEVPHN